MAMVCPQCNGTFEQRLQCPTCNVRLLFQAPSRRRETSGSAQDWQQTPWGRIAVGLLLAQGIYYVLYQLIRAGFLAAGEDTANNIWHTLTGLLLVQGLQAFGVLLAGILVGAGQRQGYVYGGVLGIWNGIVFILTQQWSSQDLTVTALMGQPLLQAAVGLLGGLIGSMVWRPLPPLQLPNPARSSRSVPTVRRKSRHFRGPIAWARVVAGTVLAVGGVMWANVILEFVLQASEGKLAIDSQLQAQLITWEICGLALLGGSALSGSSQKNGMLQGLCVGAASGSILMGLGLAGSALPMHLLLFTVTVSVPLGILGGWFGSQMLPPLQRVKRVKVAA